MIKKHYIYFAISAMLLIISMSSGLSMNIPEDVEWTPIITDTIPLKDRPGNFINDPKVNPFDITPKSIEQKVEFDPESGNYIVFEKIGEEFYRTPNMMTFEEYLNWKSKQDEKRYFQRLSGVDVGYKSRLGKIDPLAKLDIGKNLIDRLFGGTDISIDPNGSIDLILGYDRFINENPFLNDSQRSNGGFDFDMDIRMSVDGKIGDKMKLGFNYDTQATFDFDKKMKLEYDSEQFSEDDIIKKIEAGNVSFPLRSTLIQGVESLFGLKTDLQFGHLKISAIASQQRSKQKNIQVQNGAVEQDFEMRPLDYDENRHFFISHYHRNHFNDAMSNLPQIKGLADVSEIEVWVTITRNDAAVNQQKVVALSDVGEPDLANYEAINSNYPPIPSNFIRDLDQTPMPSNSANGLYKAIFKDSLTRLEHQTSSQLQAKYGLEPIKEFEIFTGRKLRPNEYTFHPKLGVLSLNQKLRPDQVLAVAYAYNLGDEFVSVGDPILGGSTSNTNQDGEPTPQNVKYLKMLKSSVQSVKNPSWDLMMKNVYSVGASQLNQEGFKFDIFYENNLDGSLVRFLPNTGKPIVDETQLLGLFNLDNLNTRLDAQQDGIFDFIPGLTIIPRSGSIIFPVLEPFGSSLDSLLLREGVDQTLIDQYVFDELYSQSKTKAERFLEKNRFVMKGKFKSSVSSQISLGAFNVPEGSVHVTAGGVELIEGVDYEINYGLGQVKIINSSYLSSGQPINIRFEDNSTFSLQQKNMLGLRAEYEISKKMNIGATYLRLFEKPYSEKVNLGDDPINNRMFGLDFNYGDEVPFITRMLDKLPFYSTKQASSINFSTEVAFLKPGHSSAIDLGDDSGGLVNLDDFEGASSGISLSSFGTNKWVLASTPANSSQFSLGGDIEANNLNYGSNRALLNWYSLYNRTGSSTADNEDSYTRRVLQDELFDRDIAYNNPEGRVIYTFDMSYYPEERGPYNFDTENIDATQTNQLGRVILDNPEDRWGGVMRSMQNTDFEALNVEYIEFWMLDPYMKRRDNVEHDDSDISYLVFNLGNVSEDILKDNLQFFENSIPTNSANSGLVQTTGWGEIPLISPINNGFSSENQEKQDLGYDGMNNTTEASFYANYLSDITGLFPVLSDIYNDPSNDDFVSVDDAIYSGGDELLKKYVGWNGTEGNSKTKADQPGNIPGNPQADIEDLNGNKSLEQAESYYEYIIPLKKQAGSFTMDTTISKYITQTKVVTVEGRSTDHFQGTTETWHRFKIPLNEGTSVGGIDGFRSIQFARMYMTGFKKPVVLRFAELELVRNQWRRSDLLCPASDVIPSLSIDQVSIDENKGKKPFNYVLPKGIKQQRLYSTFANVEQDEKSMVIETCDMKEGCEASIYKLNQMDLRQFERMQLFVHAETEVPEEVHNDSAFSIFIKLGKDFKDNYYEYELPLIMSDENDGLSLQDQVWRIENMFDFPFSLLTDLKKDRNSKDIPFGNEHTMDDPDNAYGGKAKIKGNPSIGYIKGIQIGVRRNDKPIQDKYCMEVWVNELRVSGFKEKGGMAATAKMDVQLADLGTFSAIGNYSSIGWGALDQKLAERQREELFDYSVATNLQLGKLLPKKAKLSIPFYAQYSQEFSTPEYDPYDLDLTVDENLSVAKTDEDKQAVLDRSQEKTTIKTFNFTNVKREKSSGSKKPKPWDVSNLSLSYAYTKVEHTDPILSTDVSIDQRGGIDYNYTRKATFIKPFKFIKSKHLKFFSEINFNPFPNSFTVSNQLQRYYAQRIFREPQDDVLEFAFEDKRFDWNRRYSLKWDLMKSLKLSYSADNVAVVDELVKVGFNKNKTSYRDVRNVEQTNVTNQDGVDDYWKKNFRDFGRNKSYSHRIKVDYNVPLNNIPFLNFLKVKAAYNADYSWNAASLRVESLGSVISNGQTTSINADFNFKKLYSKSKYLKNIQKTTRSKKKKSVSKKKGRGDLDKDLATSKSKKSKKSGQRTPSIIEKVLIRPLLLLRSAKFTYKLERGTLIPGVTTNPEYFGIGDKFTNPGWDFVLGIQPDLGELKDGKTSNWATDAATSGWISTNHELNQKILQTRKENLEAKFVIEPIKHMKINVNFKKQYTNAQSQLYRDTDPLENVENYQQEAFLEYGSFEVTYFTMNTLFGGGAFSIPDNKARINRIFDDFKNNRTVVSKRLNDLGVVGGSSGQGSTHVIDGGEYSTGYGAVSNQVLIPAFLAAYEGSDVNDVTLDLISDVRSSWYVPKPSWTFKYDGLSKLNWFKDIFKTFTIEHGYKSTLRVADFRTNQYQTDEKRIDGLSQNYYSEFEIPAVQIQEAFNPVIGVKVQTTGGMKFNIEYNKKRDLTLETTTKRLQEGNTSELVFGFGYQLKNVDIPFLTGSKKKRRKGKKRKSIISDKDEDDKDKKKGRKKVTDSRGNNLTISMDFSIRDDVRYVHELALTEAREDRGTKTISLAPNIEYDINKNLSLVMFFDYRKTIPYLTSSYAQTNMKGGMKVRFKLN